MEKNVGSKDRFVRIALGLGLAALAYFGLLEGTAGIVAYVAGAFLILTALLARCPMYKIAGVDTCVAELSYSTTDDRAGL